MSVPAKSARWRWKRSGPGRSLPPSCSNSPPPTCTRGTPPGPNGGRPPSPWTGTCYGSCWGKGNWRNCWTRRRWLRWRWSCNGWPRAAGCGAKTAWPTFWPPWGPSPKKKWPPGCGKATPAASWPSWKRPAGRFPSEWRAVPNGRPSKTWGACGTLWGFPPRRASPPLFWNRRPNRCWKWWAGWPAPGGRSPPGRPPAAWACLRGRWRRPWGFWKPGAGW